MGAVPLADAAEGFAGILMAKLERAFTVTEAATVVELVPLVAVAVIVPESTMTPAHVVVVLPLALETVAPSDDEVNFQLDAVPGPCNVQVTVEPLVTEEGKHCNELTTGVPGARALQC